VSEQKFDPKSLIVPGGLFTGTMLGVGWLATHYTAALAGARGAAPVAEIRLASWLAGLFAGGLAAVLVLITYLWLTRNPKS